MLGRWTPLVASLASKKRFIYVNAIASKALGKRFRSVLHLHRVAYSIEPLHE